MRLPGSARSLLMLLVEIFILSALLAGCRGSAPTKISAAAQPVEAASVPTRTATVTPAPTRTQVILPPTWTPASAQRALDLTPTLTPTATATLNSPQTMVALATANRSTKCNKNGDSWMITVSPSWQPGICQLNGLGGLFYEYKLRYPAEWLVSMFGDVFPNLAFYTYEKGVELRFYQAYKYGAKNYETTLENVPLKASFCDTSENCTPVVGAQEKITAKEIKNVGGREVMVLDSQDGKYNIRRYFFFVPFRYYEPRSNRLFFFKLYTPDPIVGDNYKEIQNQIEDVLTTVRPLNDY